MMNSGQRAQNVSRLEKTLARYQDFAAKHRAGLWAEEIATTKRTIERLKAGGEFTAYELGKA